MNRTRRIRQTKGAVIIEAAICMTFFIMLLFACAELGVTGYKWLSVQQACEMAARRGGAIPPEDGLDIAARKTRIRGMVEDFLEACGIPPNDVTIRVNYLRPDGSTIRDAGEEAESGDYVMVEADYTIQTFGLISVFETGWEGISVNAKAICRNE